MRSAITAASCRRSATSRLPKKVFRQALAPNEEVRGAGHPYVGYDHVNLANLLLLKGENAEAEKEYPRGAEDLCGTLPPDHQYVASAQTGLAPRADRAGATG